MARVSMRTIFRSERYAAISLAAAAVLGLVLANSVAGAGLIELFSSHIGLPALELDLSIGHWVTDGLLVIFFFIVAVELRHELTVGVVLAAVIGILIGIRGGWRRGGTFDSGSLFTSLALYSTPEGWLGMLLLLFFAGWLGWFPAGGFSSTGGSGAGDVAGHLALPVLALSLGYIGPYAMVMRASMIEVKAQPYITLARAKGLSDPDVRRRHAVPNALLPTFTLVVLSVGFILGGAIVIETVFSWPGIGLLTYEAIETLDYPVLQGVFLLSSSAVILAAFIADIAYGALDPQVRTS